MKVGIIVFPGSNCDEDCFYVFSHIIGVDTSYIWHKDSSLKDIDLLIIPGGFSYGDYLRCGSIAKLSPIMEAIYNYAEKGGYIIGICNGFQVLVETGLLPGAFIRNKNLKFICKYVHIKVTDHENIFVKDLDKNILHIPIAHKDGNYFIDKNSYIELEKNGRIVFKYCSSKGELDEVYNPNGSIGNIAGIINKKGNILGMMPHPERASEALLGSTDGLGIFLSALKNIGFIN
ncbi:MAG: phosphoribosylformylglycinamidine synthase I [Deferribacterota bacterium]|nr:phosphoribosylformylglycinamidine synthase I [Deferribacterota bacterium]